MRGAAFEAALLLAAGLVVAAQAICSPGRTWWNPHKDTCLNCTHCDLLSPPLFVLRPCQPHQDTVCAPLKDLDIDWSWLADYRNGHRHKHRKGEHKKKHEDVEQKTENANKDHRRIIWRFSTLSNEENPERSAEKYIKKNEPEAQVTTKTNLLHIKESAGLSEDLESYSDYDSEMEVNLGSEPLISEYDFVWDWQIIVLILAALACVVFFVVVAVYSVHHARQWRQLKRSLEADVEGLSAKLNLMMATAESSQAPETPSPGPENHYSYIRCAYLEQLLVGKSKQRGSGPGNVYIQENST